VPCDNFGGPARIRTWDQRISARLRDPTKYTNNSNGVPSYVTGSVGGTPQGTGAIKSERVLVHNVISPFWTGPLRSPVRLQNSFAHESFIDELAARAKADPVAYRLHHLSHPRLIDVVKSAANAANWDARPSPKPSIRKTGTSAGRGMACVAYEGDNGYSAMAAEVEVDQDTGKVSVKRMVGLHWLLCHAPRNAFSSEVELRRYLHEAWVVRHSHQPK
jgi:CO/xanthine dehydrogenase Mo-binding subunit